MAYYRTKYRSGNSYNAYRGAGYRGGRYGYYKSRARNYYQNKKRTWKQKYYSYVKGRKSGIIWGFLFTILLIPAIFLLWKNREIIINKLKSFGGK